MGALILKGSFQRYVGTDVDLEALSWARENVEPNVKGAKFLFPDEVDRIREAARYDLVLSHEVIEHVSSDVLGYLKSLANTVASGGRVSISTPNGALSVGDPRFFQSPYHLREYRAPEFVKLVMEAGLRPRLYLQRRMDFLDSVPAIVLRRSEWLRRGVAPVTDTRSSGEVGSNSSLIRAAWNALPSPSFAWQISPFDSGHFTANLSSHLIAICAVATTNPGRVGPGSELGA
jgi:SAM-dependent methyltransferase